MIRDLSNEEQFEKSQSRTGNPNNSQDKKETSPKEDKSSTFEDMMNVSDSKNKLKDEGMKERKDPGI